MPAGKQQFGIIMDTKLHDWTKHRAVDEGKRISDIYADGIKLLMDTTSSKRGPHETTLLKKITDRIDKQDWVLFEALADFIRSSPPADKVQMLKLILGSYMPAKAEITLERKHA